MNMHERGEMGQMRDCIQQLAVEIARLSQAVEPLVRMQQDQDSLRDRVAQLEGFRAALLWLSGLSVISALFRYLVSFWMGGTDR